VSLLELAAVEKHFGGLTALAAVDFSAAEGEVTALVGDNGAGKSTLIKIVAGAYQPDGGTVRFAGSPVRLRNPQDAWDLGIATIYQELALAGKMNVADNIFLGRELKRPVLGIPFLDRKGMRRRAAELLAELDVHIPDPEIWVERLSGGQRQGVAIARALNLDARLIIMDEPTAALAVAEQQKVLDFIRRLRDAGKAVILISHNIQDVFRVADRITVLRRGRKVGERETAATTPEEIIALITGAYELRRSPDGQKAAAENPAPPAG